MMLVLAGTDSFSCCEKEQILAPGGDRQNLSIRKNNGNDWQEVDMDY